MGGIGMVIVFQVFFKKKIKKADVDRATSAES
jgi:hypothetical protein